MKRHGEASKFAAVTEDLSAAAMGLIAADCVLKNGKIINVHTGEIESGKDIAVKHGRVVLVGDAAHTVGNETEIVDAEGYYLSPGFLDGHVHIESSMVTVTQFSRAVVPRGTTTVFMDPHEIANVLGMRGVQLMIDEGDPLPLKVLATMPSCVPSAPGFEDAGAVFGPDEIARGMEMEEIVGLGEMMNFPGVIHGDKNVHQELAATLLRGKVITGHYSIPDIEIGLQAYAAAGIASCHEGTSKEDALARMRLGMYAKMREGSAWHDVKANVKAITEENVDTRYGVLVSDDVHPHTLLEVGHLDHVVRRAIQEGVNPITAIQMVTLNPAQCFQVDRFMGSIAPGRYADILFIEDLAQVDVKKVMVDGRLVAEDGKLTAELPSFEYPETAVSSVRLPEKLTPSKFSLSAGDLEDGAPAKVHVMEIMEAQVGTKHQVYEIPVIEGELRAYPEKDILKVASLERHSGSGSFGLGFVSGFGIKAGAVASTVAHDSHNLLIMGANEGDMAAAGNELAKQGGGMIAVKDGEILAQLHLEIAGLMSNRPVEAVRDEVDALTRAWQQLGCDIVSPFMTMALLSLPVLPELRIANRGLVDTLNFQIIDVLAE